jgi:hypothetical protein
VLNEPVSGFVHGARHQKIASMLPRRPIPPDLKVSDLGQDDVYTACPKCGTTYFHLGYNITLRVPGDSLLIDYVARHVCRQCSRPGRPVRARGWIQPYHRSGAEGYRSRPD